VTAITIYPDNNQKENNSLHSLNAGNPLTQRILENAQNNKHDLTGLEKEKEAAEMKSSNIDLISEGDNLIRLWAWSRGSSGKTKTRIQLYNFTFIERLQNPYVGKLAKKYEHYHIDTNYRYEDRLRVVVLPLSLQIVQEPPTKNELLTEENFAKLAESAKEETAYQVLAKLGKRC
jgi:hypothetical protein